MLVDPKRTGVKATIIPWTEPPMDLIDHKWHGPLGAFIQSDRLNPTCWSLCCPGCSQLSGTKPGALWTATKGSFQDVSTLTLRPSIAMGCCGWHGYLNNGVFELELKDGNS
jgi:hypothetical protein